MAPTPFSSALGVEYGGVQDAALNSSLWQDGLSFTFSLDTLVLDQHTLLILILTPR